jgi:hypothetical protein
MTAEKFVPNPFPPRWGNADRATGAPAGQMFIVGDVRGRRAAGVWLRGRQRAPDERRAHAAQSLRPPSAARSPRRSRPSAKPDAPVKAPPTHRWRRGGPR